MTGTLPVEIKNNIMTNWAAGYSSCGPADGLEFVVDYNTYLAIGEVYGASSDGATWTIGEQERQEDPGFTMEGTGPDPYRLRSDSSSVDTGTEVFHAESTGVATDFDGRARPQGAGIDRGAFELSL
jgi:hypothetical protein